MKWSVCLESRKVGFLTQVEKLICPIIFPSYICLRVTSKTKFYNELDARM